MVSLLIADRDARPEATKPPLEIRCKRPSVSLGSVSGKVDIDFLSMTFPCVSLPRKDRCTRGAIQGGLQQRPGELNREVMFRLPLARIRGSHGLLRKMKQALVLLLTRCIAVLALCDPGRIIHRLSPRARAEIARRKRPPAVDPTLGRTVQVCTCIAVPLICWASFLVNVKPS